MKKITSLVTIVALSSVLLASPIVAKGLDYSIQTTLTTGQNNGNDETYTGIWLNTKYNMGLSRYSLMTFKGLLGGKSYVDNTSANITNFLISANYLYQPSSGFFAPLYSVKFQFDRESYSDVSTNNNKKSLSFFRSQPLNNQVTLALGYRISQETGRKDTDTQSLMLNLDYSYSQKTIFYTSLILSDEETSTFITAAKPSNKAAKTEDFSGGHAPGEPGYHGPALSTGNHLSNSDNTSIFLGAVYSIDSNQSIDLAYIKHFYDTNTGSSNSSYLALDYFYKF